jgi:hypothetical protein
LRAASGAFAETEVRTAARKPAGTLRWVGLVQGQRVCRPETQRMTPTPVVASALTAWQSVHVQRRTPRRF